MTMLEDLGRENVMIDHQVNLQVIPEALIHSTNVIGNTGNHNRRKHSIDETGYIEKFGEKMKRIRQAKGWTLKVAEEQGYPSWRHLSDIENGKKSVTIITLLRLSRLYSIEPAELLKDL